MEIQPDKQNLDQTFSTTVYYIDFYQRDYKWTAEPVQRLLDDVFYQFEEAYVQNDSLEPNKENIEGNYPWYYLNTYVTNTVGGRVFVVDGQQRLTTLTLILIKLHTKAKTLESKTAGWLERKIAGYSGTKHEFWMNHVHHLQVFEELMNGVEPAEIEVTSGITAQNMLKNFSLISSEIDRRLDNFNKFETFVHYLLFRLVLINLSVDTQHVPMVFEVINDRGVRLKPYEILKGKFLGQIDKQELESGKFNELWEKQVESVNEYREDEIDSFFRYWLKAKFADSRKTGQRFDGEYHRELFKNDMNEILELDHNPKNVKYFLTNDFRYFTNLYAKLWKLTQEESPIAPAVFFNSINELDNQFMLILSACVVDDEKEDEKIAVVSDCLDRMFTSLQLQGAYDSNKFLVRLFAVSTELRGCEVGEIALIFEKHLIAELSQQRSQTVNHPFSYSLFKQISIDRLNTRFTRYVFGRVERFLANGMQLQMKHDLKKLITNRGTVNGFHIEHILSRNPDNLQKFENDEDRFDHERNRLGGILLLKGKDNISSNNETFENKLKSYANTLYWNETLRGDSYKSKLDFTRFAESSGLAFRPFEEFGPVEIEERQKLLFEICSLIWAMPIDQTKQ